MLAWQHPAAGQKRLLPVAGRCFPQAGAAAQALCAPGAAEAGGSRLCGWQRAACGSGGGGRAQQQPPHLQRSRHPGRHVARCSVKPARCTAQQAGTPQGAGMPSNSGLCLMTFCNALPCARVALPRPTLPPRAVRPRRRQGIYLGWPRHQPVSRGGRGCAVHASLSVARPGGRAVQGQACLRATLRVRPASLAAAALPCPPPWSTIARALDPGAGICPGLARLAAPPKLFWGPRLLRDQSLPAAPATATAPCRRSCGASGGACRWRAAGQ